MFEYFYHEILRKTIVAFGTLFNGISIQKINSQGAVTSIIEVPLAYSSTQKFLARLEQSPDLNKPVQITLPRMSFEFTGLFYDSQRKVTTTQFFVSKDSNNNELRRAYMPAPYNMEFELNVYTKTNDDMLQIIEQILPYFQPHYTLTVDLIDKIGEKKDVPIILNSLSMNDTYEGDFSIRRALIYTLKFTAKTYLFGPVSNEDVSKDIIKKVNIGLVSGELTSSPRRELTYSVEPVATKSYTNNIVSTLTEDINISSSKIRVSDSSTIPVSSYITISNETKTIILRCLHKNPCLRLSVEDLKKSDWFTDWF
jgi:serine/threonine protein kinase